MKPRDVEENIRVSKIASAFCELAELRELIEDNPDHRDFLQEFFTSPVKKLKDLEVEKSRISKFIANKIKLPLSLQFVESFRRTESRRFWE